MARLLVLLVLVMTTFLSSLFSPAYGQGEGEEPPFSMEGWWGSNQRGLDQVRPGGVFEVPIHTGELPP
jgi:hypothetical protein